MKKQIPDWFRDARLGMFIHWGIYSVLGHGEQPLIRELMKPSEYARLADRFRAERYDPDEWAATAKKAGMKYMVLTTKHHDGFCLWNTAATSFNACQKGPKRDLVAAYVSACRKAGLRVGLYYSIPDWGLPGFWAGPGEDPAAFRDYIRLLWRQIEELVSNYGRIDLLWFDAAAWPTASHLRSTQLVKMIRRHQPEILINNRLPKPRRGGDWGYATPEQRIGSWQGAPWESCITSTRNFWGYHRCHEDPSMWCSERELLTLFVTCITRGGNLLWNVGPRADGELPRPFRERVCALGDWIRRNRRAIYGTEPVSIEFNYGGVAARKNNRLYLFFLYWPGEFYSLPGFNEKLRAARLVDGGRRIRAVQEPQRIRLEGLPQKAPDICTVIELTFDAPPTVSPWGRFRLHNYPCPALTEWLRT